MLFCTTGALACSCDYPEEWTADRILEAYCLADVVFEGEVESALDIRRFLAEYKIWPRNSFKGQLPAPTYAVSELGGKCGYQFLPGGKYLIFASKDTRTQYLKASSCGLTGLSRHRQFALDVLEARARSEEDVCSDEAIAARARSASNQRIEEFRELLKESRDVQRQE